MSDKMRGGRFTEQPDLLMKEMNASIGFDRRLWRQDIEGSLAHSRMLARQGILDDTDAKAITEGLLTIMSEIEAGGFRFSDRLEDIHMNIEARLAELVGPAAGRLHSARSRNDQVATDFRMWVRSEADRASRNLYRLIEALIGQAEQGASLVMPGFTHLQSAQPVTWGHHMMAYVEMFARDIGRFDDARSRMNESPLGAAALAGTSFPIDRDRTAKELGFDRPMANSMDAVSARDFAAEYLAAAAICTANLSRLAEEIVLWTSSRFGFATLGDRFTTGSSIMPQKRNPDAAELIRAKTGRVNGALVALLTILKALPLAYSKDLQEDKEQVFDVADNIDLSIRAMEGMIRDLQPDPERLLATAGEGYSTATDLADWLAGNAGMPFRDAHHVIGQLVRMAEDRGCPLDGLTIEDMQSVCGLITEEAVRTLDVSHSVASRTSYGGTDPARVRQQVSRWKEVLKCKTS